MRKCGQSEDSVRCPLPSREASLLVQLHWPWCFDSDGAGCCEHGGHQSGLRRCRPQNNGELPGSIISSARGNWSVRRGCNDFFSGTQCGLPSRSASRADFQVLAFLGSSGGDSLLFHNWKAPSPPSAPTPSAPPPSPPPPSSSAPAGCPDGGSSLKIPQGFLVEGFCWYYGGASQTCDQSCADIPGGSNQGPPLPLLPEQVERPTHRNCAMQTWLNSCAPCVCAVQVAWDLNVGKSSPGAIMSEMKALAVLNGISLPSGFTCTSWDSSTSIGGYGVLPQSLASCARPFFLSH